MPTNSGDPVEEVIKDGDTSQKPEETKEPLSPERVTEIINGLQKGFYSTREEMAEMRSNLQQIADSINKDSGAKEGEDEYVTVGKLREVLNDYDSQKVQAQERMEKANLEEANKIVSEGLNDLYSVGIISTKAEEDSLLNYAIKNNILDLNKAAALWIKEGEREKITQVAQKKARQEEGSKIGTSSTTGGEENKGIDYLKMKRWAREQGF